MCACVCVKEKKREIDSSQRQSPQQMPDIQRTQRTRGGGRLRNTRFWLQVVPCLLGRTTAKYLRAEAETRENKKTRKQMTEEAHPSKKRISINGLFGDGVRMTEGQKSNNFKKGGDLTHVKGCCRLMRKDCPQTAPFPVPPWFPNTVPCAHRDKAVSFPLPSLWASFLVTVSAG